MRIGFVAILLFLGGAFCGRAESPPPATKDLQSEYVVDNWQTEDGLPDNFINDVARSADGYLWIATFNGLARFNGLEFTTFDPQNAPQLESRSVTQFTKDAEERLWIFCENGALSCWSGGRFEDFTGKKWPSEGIRLVRDDGHGGVWLGIGRALYKLSDASFDEVSGKGNIFANFGHVTDIHGRCWEVKSNCLCCLNADENAAAPIPDYRAQGWRLLASRDGGIWMMSDRVRKFRDGVWSDFGLTGTDSINSYCEDHNGNLWAGTDFGQVWRISTNGVFDRFRLAGVKSSQLGRGLCEDSEGNIWLGTGGNGLFRLKPKVFKVYSSQQGLTSDLVRSVTQDREGHVLFATVNSVDWLRSSAEERAAARGLDVVLPWEVLAVRDGSLFVGTFAEGLYHLGCDGSWTRFTNSAMNPPPINVVFQEHDGTVDLGTPKGLWRWNSNCIAPAGMPPGLKNADVRALAQDSSGNLYAGLESGGMLRRTEKGWEQWTTNEGLSENHVRCLWIDNDNVVWIGMQRNGLSRFDGNTFFNYTNGHSGGGASFDLPATITALIGDDEGCLWMASNRGVHRAERDQLNRVAAGKLPAPNVIHFDRSDGMGSSECTDDHQPSVCRTSDGRLWFATTFGVSVVDPASLPLNATPPQVRIEEALIDDRPAWPTEQSKAGHAETQALRVPPEHSRLEFRFTALSLKAPSRNRYRFRLVGFESEWEEAGARRTAFYKQVPPGDYEFKVAACNDNGVWNQQGASLAVVVVPPWWKAAPVQWCAAIAAGMAIFGAYRLRVQSLLRKTAAQQEFSRKLIESQELERQRIAGELHDSLGQSLLVIKSRALLALRDPALPQRARDELEALTTVAGSAIGEARQIAHNLRPFQLDELGLTRAIRGMITNVSGASAIEITHDLAELEGAFPPDQEINVYRIIQELLNNVMKHAQASKARVTMEMDAGRVRLQVHDNGRGFEAEKRDVAGFGMRAISERVRILGGEWSVQSTPGEGATTVVILPVVK